MGGMKIMHVTRVVSIGGTEKVIQQICGASRGQFERIILCAADGGGFPAFDGCVDRYYAIDDMQEKNPLVSCRILSDLGRIIRTESVDVIHAHHRMAAMYIKVLNIFFHKTLVYNGHCIHEDKRILTRMALGGYHIIAVGDRVRCNLADLHKIDRSRIEVIHNTVDGFGGDIHEDRGLVRLKREGNTLVGNVGRLSRQKGQRYFIEAAEMVLREQEDVRFILVGDGEYRERLERLAAEKGISGQVVFLGPRDDVRSLILQFDILVLSSLWEGLPLVPIEAFSVGKAIIASNVGGTDELVEDGVNGILYDPYDPGELARKICSVIDDPEGWARLSQNALASYEERYSYQVFCDKYRDYYRRICNMDRGS